MYAALCSQRPRATIYLWEAEKKSTFETIDFPNKIIFSKNRFWNHWFSEQNFFENFLFGKSMVSKPIFQKNNFVRKINGFKTYRFFSKKSEILGSASPRFTRSDCSPASMFALAHWKTDYSRKPQRLGHDRRHTRVFQTATVLLFHLQNVLKAWDSRTGETGVGMGYSGNSVSPPSCTPGPPSACS